MPVVVQKYGGTSVADPARINAVADRVSATRTAGNDVVVVVSAMGHTTDQLLALARQISLAPPPREMDMLLTAGERISMALLAMALHERGVPAVSYTGSQAGILTDSSHGEARITRITGERVHQSLAEGKVVIVAGFQGVDPDRKEVTTLGRGGSDTTAVALAHAVGADSCEILTDVAGVYSADPRVVPGAAKLISIAYDDMLALARAGASVLMPHSVEYAQQNQVPVHVRSSFTDEEGTWVLAHGSPGGIVGIAHSASEGLITIVGAEAARVRNRASSLLDEQGIEAAVGAIDANAVTISVSRDRIEDAVRCLHGGLLEMEITK